MASDSLVDDQIKDACNLLTRLHQQGFAVDAAAWFQASAIGRWSLYIVSPLVASQGATEAYKQTHALVREIPQPFSINVFCIKLTAPDHPIAKDLAAIISRPPAAPTCPIRWPGIHIGSMSIEGAYVYRVPTSVSA
jgi:hypothetical protein